MFQGRRAHIFPKLCYGLGLGRWWISSHIHWRSLENQVPSRLPNVVICEIEKRLENYPEKGQILVQGSSKGMQPRPLSV